MIVLDSVLPNLVVNGDMYGLNNPDPVQSGWTLENFRVIEYTDYSPLLGNPMILDAGMSASQVVNLLMTEEQTLSLFVAGGSGSFSVAINDEVIDTVSAKICRNRVISYQIAFSGTATLRIAAISGVCVVGDVGIYPGHHSSPQFSSNLAETVLPEGSILLVDGAAPVGYYALDIDDRFLIQGAFDATISQHEIGGAEQHLHGAESEFGDQGVPSPYGTLASAADWVSGPAESKDRRHLYVARDPDNIPDNVSAFSWSKISVDRDTTHVMWYKHEHTAVGGFIHPGLPQSIPYRLVKKVR